MVDYLLSDFLYFTKGVITIYEEELFKLTLNELKEKYR